MPTNSPTGKGFGVSRAMLNSIFLPDHRVGRRRARRQIQLPSGENVAFAYE